MDLASTSSLFILLSVSFLTDVTCFAHFENVALHKPCQMSSYHDKQSSVEAAVNGDTNGTFPQNCIHTGLEDTKAWWEVNLGRPYPLHNITIWARTDYLYRMKNCVITVDGKDCCMFTNVPSHREINIHCTMNGTVIRVSKNSTSTEKGDNTINICEFQVSSCTDDSWGPDCENDCGNCAEKEVCDKLTGHCPNCSKGWVPPFCVQECPAGTFGLSCEQNCSVGCEKECNKEEGNCTCKPGWKGYQCKEECPSGFFGVDCTQNCSDHCVDTCDKANGYCTCQTGYKTPQCFDECDAGTYGQNCQEDCGVCIGKEACNHVDGNCTACSGNLLMPLCKDPTKKNSGLGSISIAFLAFVLVALLLIAAMVTHVRQRRKRRLSKLLDTNTTGYGSVDGTPSAQDTIYQNMANAVQEGTEEENKSLSSSVSEVKADDNLGFFRLKDNSIEHALPQYVQPPGDNMSSQQSLVASIDEDAFLMVEDDSEELEPKETLLENVVYNDDVDMTSEGPSLMLDDVQQYLLNRLRSDVLDTEFKSLPAGLANPVDSGCKEENRYKNRFTTILPYDERRVVLRGNPDPGSNDYVNASYIKSYQSPRAYIATQGPKTNTLGDFWKMVWQDHVTHIIMLTNLKENGKVKCDQYWPARGDTKRYGSVDVTGLFVRKRTDYVMRTFDIKAENEALRHVTQYHYTTWPDHSIPETLALVEFWRMVNVSCGSQDTASPIVVHCNAGVGRTGTFIALDILMNQLMLYNAPIDVFRVVKGMRNDRCNMIQTKWQYRILHEALLEAYTSQDCRLSALELNSIFPETIDPQVPHNRINTEFKKLKQMKLLLYKPRKTEAKCHENINKNKDETHRMHLSLPMEGRNDYINAVYVSGTLDHQGCILTQFPMPDTVIDLWRLVVGNDVSTIVSLSGPGGVPEYWPTTKGQHVTFGPFSVYLTSVTSRGEYIRLYSLSVYCQDFEQTKQVELIYYDDWTNELPGSSEDVTQLVDMVLSAISQTDNNHCPILLQCTNGVSKSGLFCAILDVIRRMLSDKEVEVYMAVRKLHLVLPDCIDSKVQYRYIYHIAQEYKTRTNIYYNV